MVCRTYAGDAGMTLSELQEQVINVLKMFDKINPDKVRSVTFSFSLLSLLDETF